MYYRIRVHIPFAAELKRQMHGFGNIDKFLEYVEHFTRNAAAKRPSFQDEYGVLDVIALPRDSHYVLRLVRSLAKNANTRKQSNKTLNELLGRTETQERVEKAVYDLAKDNVSITSNSLARQMRFTPRTARRWLVRFKKKGWITIYTRTSEGKIYAPSPDFGVYRIEINMAKLADKTEAWLEKHDVDETFRRDYTQNEFTLVIKTIPTISIEGLPQSLFS